MSSKKVTLKYTSSSREVGPLLEIWLSQGIVLNCLNCFIFAHLIRESEISWLQSAFRMSRVEHFFLHIPKPFLFLHILDYPFVSFGQWVDEFLNCWVLCVLGWLAPCWLDHQSGEWIRAGALIPTGKKTLSMKSSLNESRLNLHPYPWFKKQNLLSVSHLPENKQWFSLGPDPTGPPVKQSHHL